jgi:uncharacterized RDD family membrane protein YckC/Tfp pilus assembly major pilin PilA
MQIHINRDGQNYGPYSLDEVRQYLASGNLIATDLAWFEGASGWMPLSQVPGVAPSARPAAQASPVAAASPAAQPARAQPAAAARPRPAEVAPAAAAALSADGLSHAGFWKRVVAYAIDGFLLGVLSWVLSAAVGALILGAAAGGGEAAITAALGLTLVLQVLFIAGMWLYFALLESGRGQATLGKRALGIVVTDLSGERIGFGRATGRFFGKMLSGLILAIGFLMAAFTARKQGLHDMLASTLVLNKDPNDTRVPWWGWVIVALFALLPILGIVAAISIPAYNDYTQRAVTAGAINEANGAKVAIAEFVLANQRLPDSLSEAGIAEQLSGAAMSLQDGVLVLTLAAPGTAADGGTIGLEPYQDAGGSVVWRCGNAEPPAGASDFTGGDASFYTSLPSTMLPVSCR